MKKLLSESENMGKRTCEIAGISLSSELYKPKSKGHASTFSVSICPVNVDRDSNTLYLSRKVLFGYLVVRFFFMSKSYLLVANSRLTRVLLESDGTTFHDNLGPTGLILKKSLTNSSFWLSLAFWTMFMVIFFGAIFLFTMSLISEYLGKLSPTNWQKFPILPFALMMSSGFLALCYLAYVEVKRFRSDYDKHENQNVK